MLCLCLRAAGGCGRGWGMFPSTSTTVAGWRLGIGSDYTAKDRAQAWRLSRTQKQFRWVAFQLSIQLSILEWSGLALGMPVAADLWHDMDSWAQEDSSCRWGLQNAPAPERKTANRATGPQPLWGSWQACCAGALQTGQTHGVRYRDGSRSRRRHPTARPRKPHRCRGLPQFSEDAVEWASYQKSNCVGCPAGLGYVE